MIATCKQSGARECPNSLDREPVARLTDEDLIYRWGSELCVTKAQNPSKAQVGYEGCGEIALGMGSGSLGGHWWVHSPILNVG